MKSFALLHPLFGAVLNGLPLALANKPTCGPKYRYELDRVFEVEGRQGIATNGTHYFNSGSTALYTYDRDGKLVMSNEDPFAEGLEQAANHIGDISVYNSKIYAGAEWFDTGVGTDIQAILYDADTLQYATAGQYDPDSGQQEMSALAVSAEVGIGGFVWTTDWVNGDYVYRYAICPDENCPFYAGKVHLLPPPQWQQGIAYYKGDLFITADDGNADRKEADNLWRIPADLGVNLTTAYTQHELLFDMFRDVGEIEGIDFDEERDEMIVLANRGMQIHLGMPVEPYPGYEGEIHEVYVFKIFDDTNETSDGSDTTEIGSSNGTDTTETGSSNGTDTTETGSSNASNHYLEAAYILKLVSLLVMISSFW